MPGTFPLNVVKALSGYDDYDDDDDDDDGGCDGCVRAYCVCVSSLFIVQTNMPAYV